MSDIETQARARVTETLTALADAEAKIAATLTRKAPKATALIALHTATAVAYTRAASRNRSTRHDA